MFNISHFIAQQKLFGFARPNYFEIYLSSPNLIDDLAAKAFSRIYCKASSVPSVNLNYVEIPFKGVLATIPTTRFYDEWQVTITNDVNYVLRTRMENWISEINGKFGVPEGRGLNVGNIIELFGGKSNSDLRVVLRDLWVVQYSNGLFIRPTATYLIRDAFPSTVSSIELAWDNNDVTEDYTVSFRFQYFERKTLVELPGEIIRSITGRI